MSRSACVGVAVLAMACGSDGEKSTTVVIDTEVPPALIAFRDESASNWEIVTGTSPTTFELRPTGPYRVLVVCEIVPTRTGQIPSIQLTVLGRTLDDGASIEPVAGLPCPSGDLPHTVSGTMAVRGLVQLGPGRASATPQAPGFTLRTTAGLHDLVILTGDSLSGFDQMAIRRDIGVNADLELGDVLANAQLAALTPKTFTLQNQRENETMSATLTLRMPASSVLLLGGGESGTWTVQLPPQALLRPTDRQSAVLSASTRTTTEPPVSYSRAISRDIDLTTPEAIVLSEPLGPVAFDTTASRLTATWSTLPPYETLGLSRAEFGTRRSLVQRAILTQSFAEAIDATNIELDLETVTGFRPEWRFDPSVQQSISFGTREGQADSSTTTAMFTLRPLVQP